MEAALGLITRATIRDTDGRGYIAIYDSGNVGTVDMGLFYINHTSSNGVVLNTEIKFMGVLTNFGTTLTDGFLTPS